jgi:hypothetical protein
MVSYINERRQQGRSLDEAVIRLVPSELIAEFRASAASADGERRP